MNQVAKIAGGTVTLDAAQVVGKKLFAKRKVRVYDGFPKSDNYYDIAAGQLIGYVYSWVQKIDGVWWEFQYTDGSSYYCKHDPNAFDWASFEQQFPAGTLPEPSGLKIPVWALGAVSLFSFFQSTQPENKKYKMLWQLGAFGAAGYAAATAIGKVDLNPFDNLLDGTILDNP
jgi:hypothetical protein